MPWMRIRRTVRIMGEVAAKIRVMPSGMDVDLNKLKDALTKVCQKEHEFTDSQKNPSHSA